MGFMDWINEQIYILFSMKYFEVFLYLNKRQVGRIIQLVSFDSTYIVDFKRKKAWPIVVDAFFDKGNRLIGHYRLDYALPLVESEHIEVIEIGNVIQTKKVSKLSATITKAQKKNAEPMKLISMTSKGKVNGKEIEITPYNLPPDMIFEKFNAYFVTFTLSKPKSTDWTMICIGIFIVVIVVVFMLVMVFGVF